MQRIGKRAAKPAPVETPSAPAEIVTPAAPTPAQGTAIVTADANALLAKLGGFARSTALAPAKSGGSTPWLGFHSGRSTRAGDVTEALSRIVEGTPYLAVGDSYYNASHWAFTLLNEFPFWCTLGADFQPEHIRLTDPGWGAKHAEGAVWKAQILTVMLHLPGAEPLPSDLKPATVSLSTFRATKVDAAKKHVDAIERATKSAWARANGDVAAKVPERFRVTSKLLIEAKTARSGFAYQVAKSSASTISVPQMEAVFTWIADPECQLALEDAQKLFETKVAELTAKAT